jgi:hypothetical protein
MKASVKFEMTFQELECGPPKFTVYVCIRYSILCANICIKIYLFELDLF